MRLSSVQLGQTGFLVWVLGVRCIGKWVLWSRREVLQIWLGIFLLEHCPQTETPFYGVIKLRFSIRMSR